MLPLTKIFDSLKMEEGFRANPYKCTANRLTIGYGRNLDDMGISEPEATYLLVNDVNRCVLELKKAFDWYADLNPELQAVLVELNFWLGLTRLRGFKKCLAALRAGNRPEAAAELLSSRLYRQVPGRCQRYADRIKGDDQNGSKTARR